MYTSIIFSCHLVLGMFLTLPFTLSVLQSFSLRKPHFFRNLKLQSTLIVNLCVWHHATFRQGASDSSGDYNTVNRRVYRESGAMSVTHFCMIGAFHQLSLSSRAYILTMYLTTDLLSLYPKFSIPSIHSYLQLKYY